MTVEQQTIALAITRAPAWALVSLTMPDADLRERGAEELACWITRHADADQTDPRQIALPLA